MKLLVLFFLLLPAATAVAQGVDQRVNAAESGQKLTELLSTLEASHQVRFYYLPEWIATISLDRDYSGKTIQEILTSVLTQYGISVIVMNERTIVLVKNPEQDIARAEAIQSAVKQSKVISRMSLGKPGSNQVGEMKVKLRGRVMEEQTGNPLTGAAVVVDPGSFQQATTTDNTGHFEFIVLSGRHLLSIGYLNFDESLIDLTIYQDADITIELKEIPTLLDEIIIAGSGRGENTTNRVGQSTISVQEIKRAPSMLGEVDLIKQVQVMPGVTTAGEAASGFNVRGGGVDQNLVLYDDVPVFNSSHAFGFFSTFNAEAVRDVSFYRGGIPAEFGGRVSSVLDIRSKEGSYDKWGASGGIGLISSNLMVNGPIVKGSSSLAISGRWTYSDWLINTIRTNYADLRNASVFFFDGTIKASHRFNNNTKLTLSGYSSHDQFRLHGDSSYRWNNMLGTLRLDHQFTETLSMNISVGSGSYQYLLNADQPETAFELSYRILYPFVKAAVNYQAGNHTFSFGGQSTYQLFDPGRLKAGESSNVREYAMDRQRNLESAVYASDAIALGDKTTLDAGLRFSMFNCIGPASINLYEEGVPMDPNTVTDIQQIPDGEIFKTFTGLEPRASLRYSFTPSLSVKAGYNRMYQYLHLVSNTTAVTPIDIWQPSGYYFKPQVGDQVSLGIFKDLKAKMYETFVEVYYKKTDNIVDFKDGAQLFLNSHLETDLLQGQGTSYGVEASVSRISGRLTGSVNYAFSRSFRLIAGATEEESINKGERYPSNYDQPHMLNIAWRYGLSRRVFFTGLFTFRSGRPITIPESGFVIDNMPVASFSERNQYRIPNYHRLDLALVVEGNHRRRKILDGTWTLSLYNVYARKNVYTVFFKDDGHGYLRPYQLSIIGTALPSLSYSFKI